MDKRLKEKLADFMGSEELVDEFSEIADEKQRKIEEEKMIRRGNEDAKEEEKSEDKDKEVVGANDDTQEVEIELDELLEAEIDQRATEIFNKLIIPINESITKMREGYEGQIATLESELKKVRSSLEEISAIADKVEDIVETETPVGRRRISVGINRPTERKTVSKEESEDDYEDTVEMRNKRFEKLMKRK